MSLLLVSLHALAQGLGGIGGIGGAGGVGGGLTVGTSSFNQGVQGNGTNQAGTCGASGAGQNMCTVTITISAGHFAVFVGRALNGLAISSTGCVGPKQYIPGNDQSGISITQSTTMSMVGQYITSTCTNPTILFNGSNANNSTVTVYDFGITGGAPALDAYNSSNTGSGAGSPFNGIALTCTGPTQEIVVTSAFAVATITAVASPYATNAFFKGANNWIGVGGDSAIANNSPVCPTPSWTGAANTQSALLAAAWQYGSATSCVDWTQVNPGGAGFTNGNVPASADMIQNTNGFVGTGNVTIGSPAWAVSNGTTGITYSNTLNSPNVAARQICGGGGIADSGTGVDVIAWATSTATKGQLSWRPPNGTTHITYGHWFQITVPTNAASGQWSLPSTNNGTDIVNPLIQTTGSALPLKIECNGSAGGTISAGLTPSHWYWIAHDFTTGNGNLGKLALYDSDGVTLLGSASCTNTASGNVTIAGFAGISGAEAEEPGGGHFLYFGRAKYDRTGAQSPMLPSS